ncbi:MAG: methyl-accepting chemotaxis protein, partial [Acetobacteraceae bacterium]|nr:methyl-accepting chemotaxis protein [Acetobacteraceae bacterium]
TRLVPDIRRTAELVAEISAACREQDIGAEQINQAIQQLDKVTQQNASASEQMSATSEELAAQAAQLQSSIAYFRVEQDDGERRAPLRPPVRPPVGVRAAVADIAMRSQRPVAAKAAYRAKSAKANGHAAPLAGVALDFTGADGSDNEFVRY